MRGANPFREGAFIVWNATAEGQDFADVETANITAVAVRFDAKISRDHQC